MPPPPPPRPAAAAAVPSAYEPYAYSQAHEFDKGSRRSVSEYPSFSNRSSWSKFERQLLGQAYADKCEDVLNPAYTPDPHDDDSIQLFESKKRFMFAVFSKHITEPKGQEILRKYSDPRHADFGNSQLIFAELRDHFAGGATARTSVSTLEVQLTTMRMNKTWTKSVQSFITEFNKLVTLHKQLTNDLHTDEYYKEKLNMALSEHRDMSAYIEQIRTQDQVLQRRFAHIPGASLASSYDDFIEVLEQYAITLDQRYKTVQTGRRSANQGQRGTTANTGRGNGCGNGGRGNDRG